MESTFRMDDAVDQVRVEMVVAADAVNHVGKIDLIRLEFSTWMRCRKILLEAFDLGGRDIHVAVAFSIHIQPRDLAHDFAPLVPDGKPVIQDSKVCRPQTERECQQSKSNEKSVCQPHVIQNALTGETCGLLIPKPAGPSTRSSAAATPH